MLENIKYKQKIILLITIVLLLTFASLFFIYVSSRKNLILEHRERLERTFQLITNILNRDAGKTENDIINYIHPDPNLDAKYLNFLKEISGNDIFIIKENKVLLSTQKEVSSVKILGSEMEAGGNRYSIKTIPLASADNKKTGIFIIALSQKDLNGALKHLRLIILLIAFGSLSVSVILGATLIRTLTSPLSKLVKFTEQVGMGNFPDETTFKGSDEVSVLGRHFLEMTKKLKSQKKALDSYTTGLEDAVIKRTLELLTSKEEWVRTFNSITDYVLILDKNHQITRANKVLLDKLDLTNQELSGKKCYEIFCGKENPPEGCPIQETLSTGSPTIREISYGKFLGYFLVTASPLINEQNEVTGTVYVAKDITEHHNMRAQMINAEKLASLGQMAAGFAHEINNPMASIAGCTELLIDRLDDAEHFRNAPDYEYFHEYLNIIYREAFRCKDIIRGMLSFSRRQFEKRTFSITSVIREIISMLEHNIKTQKIHVAEDYGSKINSLEADEGEVRQVLLGLIVNAVDAMPNGGTLNIKTWDSDKNFHIEIQDTGSGIPPDIRNRIFEPFFTTKPVGKGTGLGLFIAFNIMKNYNGKIELVSTNSKGTTFALIFPLTPLPSHEEVSPSFEG